MNCSQLTPFFGNRCFFYWLAGHFFLKVSLPNTGNAIDIGHGVAA